MENSFVGGELDKMISLFIWKNKCFGIDKKNWKQNSEVSLLYHILQKSKIIYSKQYGVSIEIRMSKQNKVPKLLCM